MNDAIRRGQEMRSDHNSHDIVLPDLLVPDQFLKAVAGRRRWIGPRLPDRPGSGAARVRSGSRRRRSNDRRANPPAPWHRCPRSPREGSPSANRSQPIASRCNRGAADAGGSGATGSIRRNIDDIDRLDPLAAGHVGRLGGQADPAVRDQSGQRHILVELAGRPDDPGRADRAARRG